MKEIWHIVLNFFNHIKAWFVNIEVRQTNIETLIVINGVLLDGIEHSGDAHTKQAVKRIAELHNVEPELHALLVQKGFSNGLPNTETVAGGKLP